MAINNMQAGMLIGGGPSAMMAGQMGSGFGLGALMGPIGLGLMGFGSVLNVMGTLKQYRQMDRDYREKIDAINRKMVSDQSINLEEQSIVNHEALLKAGRIASHASKNVRMEGSPKSAQQATLTQAERIRNLMAMKFGANQAEAQTMARELDYKRRQMKSNKKWDVLADILGGAGSIGIAGYQMDFWG